MNVNTFFGYLTFSRKVYLLFEKHRRIDKERDQTSHTFA
jgi:hypothetical protein